MNQTTVEIPLAGGMVAFIDARDAVLVGQFRWCAKRQGHTIYAKTTLNGDVCTSVTMHRLVARALPGQCVDHINGNGLDNRRSNLRIVSYSENNMNRKPHKDSKSCYKGVYWEGRVRRWRAELTAHGVRYRSKRFRSAEEAAVAYDSLASKYHGDYARLNFPDV